MSLRRLTKETWSKLWLSPIRKSRVSSTRIIAREFQSTQSHHINNNTAYGIETTSAKKRMGIIGVGTLGRRISDSILRSNMFHYIEGTVANKKESKQLNNQVNFHVHTCNATLAKRCPIIILAVKPHQVAAVCDEIKEYVSENTVLISVAAGVDMKYLDRWVPRAIKVRAMPNLPVAQGLGSVALYSSQPTVQIKSLIRNIFGKSTCCWVAQETDIDLATVVSGCAPAYIAHFTEVMIEEEVIVPVIYGTGKLMETIPPQTVVNQTACKGGATQRAMRIFDQRDFSSTIWAVQRSALERIQEIRRTLD